MFEWVQRCKSTSYHRRLIKSIRNNSNLRNLLSSIQGLLQLLETRLHKIAHLSITFPPDILLGRAKNTSLETIESWANYKNHSEEWSGELWTGRAEDIHYDRLGLKHCKLWGFVFSLGYKGRCQQKKTGFFGTLYQTSNSTHPPRTFGANWKMKVGFILPFGLFPFWSPLVCCCHRPLSWTCRQVKSDHKSFKVVLHQFFWSSAWRKTASPTHLGSCLSSLESESR